MELVTIVIPTYKRSEKIERALKSAVSQTYKRIEIVVVDDNANNPEERIKTEKIVRKFNNIKLIQNSRNLGGALTRNVGINNSNGKYIAFLDDDDEFINDKIEKQMKLIKEKEKAGHKVGLVYCYKRIINERGKTVFIGKRNDEGNCLYEHMIECVETTSTWLCSKKALLDVGMFENVKAHQDNILLLKLLASGYEIFRVPEVLLNFYLHNGNGITNKDEKYIEYTKVLINYKRKYYSKLDNKQIKNVEYANSCQLLELYKKNNMKKDYIHEMKTAILCKPFKKHNLRLIYQLLFWKEK